MAEKNSKNHSDLKYGAIGRIRYDEQSKSWLSQRSLTNTSTRSRIQVLDKTPAVIVESNDSYVGQEPLELEGREKQVRHLIQQRPEFGPTYSSLLGNFNQEEADWHAHDSQRDWMRNGDLMAFGDTCNDQRGRVQLTSRIAAFPCSASGEEVAICELRDLSRSWTNPSKNTKGASIIVSDFGPNASHTTYWPGDGGKVQQLLFGVPQEDPKRSFLAIRSSAGLTILTFVRRRNNVRSSFAKGRSVLELQLVGSLKIPGVDHHEFADVCFSPWDQANVAAITSQGKWCVWEITASTVVSSFRVTPKATGDTTPFMPSRPGNGRTKPLNDGWYKINFLTSEHVLVICTRFDITVVDLVDENLQYEAPRLGLADTPHAILDIRASTLSYEELFLVTSTHIFWLRLKRVEQESGVFKAFFETLISWQHYRDVTDWSLRLSIRDESSSIYAVLHSTYTNIVTEYRFRDEIESTVLPNSLANPSIVDLPVDIFTDDLPVLHKRQILSLYFHPVRYDPSVDGTASGIDLPLVAQYCQKGVTFFQIFMHFRDQSIGSILCCVQRSPGEDDPQQPLEIRTPLWSKGTKVRAPKAVNQPDLIINDDSDASGIDMHIGTVESDHGEDDLNDNISQLQKILPWRQNFVDIMPESTPAKAYQDSLMYSIQSVYHELCKNSEIEVIPFTNWVHSLPKFLFHMEPDKRQRNGIPLRTLASLRDLETLQIGNTEENSNALSQLFAIGREVSPLDVKILPMPNLRNLPKYTDADSIPNLYQQLISCYVTSLSEEIHNRARLAREKLVRELAVTIGLASVGARVLSDDELQARQEEIALPDAPHSQLVEQGSQISNSEHRQLQLSDRSVGLPVSPITTPGIYSQASQASPADVASPLSQGTAAPPAPTLDNSAATALKRLKAYTDIDPPSSLRDAPRSETLDRVLAHWTIGSDPSLYDYNETVAHLSGTSVIEGSAMSAEQQRRIFERAERRRLREEQRSTKRSRLENLQLSAGGAPLVSASQPVGNFAAAVSTRRNGFSGLSGSQPQSHAERVRNNINAAAHPGSSQLTQSQSDQQNTAVGSSQVSMDTGFIRPERPDRSTQLSSRKVMEPQSQVEPGRFGGRTRIGAPGKKRKAGF